MKKRLRVQTVTAAIMRSQTGLLSPELLQKEIAAGVTGTVTLEEVTKLVKKQSWTQQVADIAQSLGLIVERVSGKRGGKKIGQNQEAFAAAFPALFNGRLPITADAEAFMKEWIGEYGLKGALQTCRKIAREASKDFDLGIYLRAKTGKKTERTAKSAA